MNLRKLSGILLCLVLLLTVVPNGVMAEKPDHVYGQITKLDMYGRSVLETKDNAEALLYAYDQIAAGIGAAANTINVSKVGTFLSQDELLLVMELYRNDYMGHFWYTGAYSYSMTGDGKRVVNVIPKYIMSGRELEAAVNAFEARAEEILSGLTPGMTEAGMELYIHDRLASVVTYGEGEYAHNAYGALVDGVAVCEGYAEAFGYLMQRIGIQTFAVTGSSKGAGHEWNYVRIDGSYYQVDVTWDDQGSETFHMYFNETDKIMNEDHVLDDKYHIMDDGHVPGDDCQNKIPLPPCDSPNDYYFYGTSERLDTYTVESVAALLKNNGYKIHVYIPENPDAFIPWFEENIVQIAEQMGITGGFSYKYIQFSHEFHLEIVVPGGAPDPVPQGIHISGIIHSHSSSGKHSPVTVILCKDGQPLMSVTVSGGDASYGFDNVMPGEYTLQIREDGYITEEIKLAVGSADVVQDADMYQKGDISGDGKVNNRDVTRLMQHLAGWDVETVEWAMDVTGDGKVNNRDATRLLQYLANWDVPIYPQK